jgi:putative ABC transport system ATP-binding protein
VLSFDRVSKHRTDGRRRVAVLREASFQLMPGMAAGVWGGRRSGKTTLLRLAAGVELPDEGRVLIGGRDTLAMRALERERLLREEVGLVSTLDWRPGHRERVLDYVGLPLLSRGASLKRAAEVARCLLRRMTIPDLSERLTRTLSVGERIRAMLARALMNEPRLLLIDEPAAVPGLGERDDLCELLGSLARERELTMLIASEDMGSLRCADFLMSVGAGELVRSDERCAEVLPFPAPADVRLECPGQ